MAKNSYFNRKSRLDQLVGLLASEDAWTSRDLSLTLKVSQRTLVRDLDVLSRSGIGIESDRGRGGGVRLARNWEVGRLQLNHAEVIDLLLALATMEKLKSPLLLKSLRSVRMKLARAFPVEQRKTILELRNRIYVAERASDSVIEKYVPPRAKVLEPVQSAFFGMDCLDIQYRDEGGRITTRTIEPQILVYSWPVWYVQAWDRLREDVRFFRLDRIRKADPLELPFKLRRDADFLRHLEMFCESI